MADHAKVVYGNQSSQGHDWSIVHTSNKANHGTITVHLVVYEFAESMRNPLSVDRFDIQYSYDGALRAFLEDLTTKIESCLRI